MRIRVALSCPDRRARLPFHYHHALTSAIYRWLARSDRDYAAFLHDQGYRAEGRPFKLFTFSFLKPRRARLDRARGALVLEAPELSWQISSPVADFVRHLADGLLRQGELCLGVPGWSLRLEVAGVEALASPPFERRMRLVCLSPLVASTMCERGGRLLAHYYRHDDPRLPGALHANLLKKYRLIHGQDPPADAFRLAFDADYLARRGGRVSKLVDFKGTKIKGVFCPFTVEAHPALIEVGYEAGFGEKNSMGFGMVEVVC